MALIDGDSHLYEPRSMWLDHIEPADRHLALTIEDDELGYAWLRWNGRPIHEAEIQFPGRIMDLGAARQARRRGEVSKHDYDRDVPDSYFDPTARLALLDEQGLDGTVLFPNHGLVWEDIVGSIDPVAMRANMRAHNRWMAEATHGSEGRLIGVGHLHLGDPDWVEAELASMARGGLRLAMVGPSLVNGRSLAHPEMDRIWSAFTEHGVAPVFHVGGHARPFEAGWYDLEDDPVNTFTDSVLLWAAPAVALTNMATFGVFERHPELRVGVVELSAGWVPAWLMYLDGGVGFITALLGHPSTELSLSPGDYIRRQVRFGALAYEQPKTLIDQAGELFMFGSDWPHAEGIADPIGDFRAANPDTDPAEHPALFGGNVAWLAGVDG